MKKFRSLALVPGTTGEFYYNTFFNIFNLDYQYKAFKVSDLANALKDAKKNECFGISVTSPFKTEILKYLDYKSDGVNQYQSCNTVLNVNGNLLGYNTDVFGVKYTLNFIKPNMNVLILGDGAMSLIYQYELSKNGLKYRVCARKDKSWDLRSDFYQIVINCTSIGEGEDVFEFKDLNVGDTIIDVSMNLNYLASLAKLKNLTYVSGIDFYKHVFINQFYLYTGIPISGELFDEIRASRK